jgi:hypothetical protein
MAAKTAAPSDAGLGATSTAGTPASIRTSRLPAAVAIWRSTRRAISAPRARAGPGRHGSVPRASSAVPGRTTTRRSDPAAKRSRASASRGWAARACPGRRPVGPSSQVEEVPRHHHQAGALPGVEGPGEARGGPGGGVRGLRAQGEVGHHDDTSSDADGMETGSPGTRGRAPGVGRSASEAPSGIVPPSCQPRAPKPGSTSAVGPGGGGESRYDGPPMGRRTAPQGHPPDSPGDQPPPSTTSSWRSAGFPPPRGSRPRPWWPTIRSTNGPPPISKDSGPTRPAPSTGSSPGTPCSSGNCRSPGGSWGDPERVGQLPRPSRRRRAATAWPTTSKANRATHRTITYAELLADVERFANVLKGLGVRRGDRVAIYMPMIPELPVAMLACTRIGAAHSVVFGGFSPDALRDRINDAAAKVLITADGGWRRGAVVALKENADTAVAAAPIDRARGGGAAHRGGRWSHPHDGGPRPVVGRPHGRCRRRPAPPSTWTPRTCSTSSTPRGPRPSPRGSCTPPGAISPRWPSPIAPSSTCTPRATSTGARPTSAG